MEDLLKKFLEPSQKVVADKAKFPEETVKEVEKKLLSVGLKIYKGVKRVDKGRLGIPVYLSLYDIEGQRITGKFKQMGKGATETLAKASALMELVERFSLFFYYKKIHEIGKFATFEELGDKAIPFENILKSVEDEEDKKTKEIAKRFLKKVPFHFVPAFEFRTKEIKYLPFHWFWLLYEYNGSAAGNTYPEASVQGVCELIERHVSAYSIRENSPMSAIKRDSIKGEAKELLNCYERLRINLWIRDMTFGMPVPTIAVMAMDPSTYPHRSEIVYTAGTATSPERALIRALTEIAQLAGDFDTEGRYEESGLPKFSTLEEAKNVINYTKEISLNDLPNLYAEDHVKELELLSEKMKNLGYEIYLVDITHSALNLPAVYTIIPGMLFRERTKISLLYQLIRTISLFIPVEENKKILEEILKEVEDKYYLWAYLGTVHKNSGKNLEAIFCYEKALQLSPPEADKIAIYTHIADTYFRMEEYKKVIETVLKGLEIEEIPELYNLLGRAYYRLGDYFQAMEAFLRATELAPASAIDYANVGYCLKAINQLSTAQIFFRKALELDPDLTMAKRGLEYCEAFLNTKN
ncbi:YcaO-like family protein [Thermodesulfobacterium hydrogeniphilum]|uniref:YcaO-like family protein n=1 Tax=Thermodesulfobacterium hydrogeniphilum TaxID=161156 RepID=UPI0005700C69|nr:YcaO-like family protein [Thermodesulfobacterium hydrogeniphilum]